MTLKLHEVVQCAEAAGFTPKFARANLFKLERLAGAVYRVAQREAYRDGYFDASGVTLTDGQLDELLKT